MQLSPYYLYITGVNKTLTYYNASLTCANEFVYESNCSISSEYIDHP